MGNTVFAIYFSAHWCPPCRGFTPKLAEWYLKSLKAKGLEVLFVSSDRDQESFDDYFKEMPWLALDFADRKAKEELSSLFGVSGIPSLVIVDKDGNTINKDGPGEINEVPTVIALCETSEAAEQKSIEEMMTPIAQRYLDQQKAAKEESPAIAFMIGTAAGGICGQLRNLMSLPSLPPTEGNANTN